MKYKQINKTFLLTIPLPGGATSYEVSPFNGEDINQLGWSHGFTYFKFLKNKPEYFFEDGYGFCGINYFEQFSKQI